ncbi:MAG: helix-turn-helix domain-containing protein [Rhodospirillaceae bacterium]
MAKIDRAWFRDKLADKNESQAALARFLGIDPSNVSQLLNGRRRVHMDLAEKIASFLGVAPSEVLRAFGAKVPEPAGAVVKFPLIGLVTPEMEIRENSPCAEVEGHAGLPADAVAVRAQTAGSFADWLDGWLLYFRPRACAPPEVTRLCVAELADGSRRVGNLRRGYRPGTFNLVLGPGSMIENLRVMSSSPVLWIRP